MVEQRGDLGKCDETVGFLSGKGRSLVASIATLVQLAGESIINGNKRSHGCRQSVFEGLLEWRTCSESLEELASSSDDEPMKQITEGSSDSGVGGKSSTGGITPHLISIVLPSGYRGEIGDNAGKLTSEGELLSSESETVSLWVSAIGDISLNGVERDRTRRRGLARPDSLLPGTANRQGGVESLER